jgi:hypothetical protein
VSHTMRTRAAPLLGELMTVKSYSSLMHRAAMKERRLQVEPGTTRDDDGPVAGARTPVGPADNRALTTS